jgi:hypothetical protein
MAKQSGRDDLVRRPDRGSIPAVDDVDRLQIVDADASSLDEFASEEQPDHRFTAPPRRDAVTERVSEPVTPRGDAAELPLRFQFELETPFQAVPSPRRSRRHGAAFLSLVLAAAALVAAFFVLPQDTRLELTRRVRLELARLIDKPTDARDARSYEGAVPSASAPDAAADSPETSLQASGRSATADAGAVPSTSARGATADAPDASPGRPPSSDAAAAASVGSTAASVGSTADAAAATSGRRSSSDTAAPPSASAPGATADSPETSGARSVRSTAPGVGATPSVPPAPSSSSAPPAAIAREHGPGDVSGSWLLTNYVDQSSVEQFRTLTLGFKVQFEQRAGRISGRGIKVMENGRMISGRARTPIAVDGVFDGQSLRLTIVEGGTRRTSRGTLALHVAGDGSLEGEFASDAGASSGRSRAVRVREESQ